MVHEKEGILTEVILSPSSDSHALCESLQLASEITSAFTSVLGAISIRWISLKESRRDAVSGRLYSWSD
jgi:hypothetical protein